MARGREALNQGDLPQASEKGWGAAAQMLKAIGEKRGWRHDGHRELFQIVGHLVRETGDDRISELFHVANSLHINFYEHWLPEEMVRSGIDHIRELLDRLEPRAGSET